MRAMGSGGCVGDGASDSEMDLTTETLDVILTPVEGEFSSYGGPSGPIESAGEAGLEFENEENEIAW